jgi:hypothetical protein
MPTLEEITPALNIFMNWNAYKSIVSGFNKEQVAECNKSLVSYMIEFPISNQECAKNVGKYLKLVNSIEPKLTIDFWQALCDYYYTYPNSDTCKNNMRLINNNAAIEIINAATILS